MRLVMRPRLDNNTVTVKIAPKLNAHTVGERRKAWVIDQMIRALTDDGYEDFVALFCDGEDGPETYHSDIGIPPSPR